jgi:hypothetical protein
MIARMRTSLRRVVSTATLIVVLSACGSTSVSTLPAHNVATGFIDAFRVNDAPTVCFMTTAGARRDLARLLRQSGAPGGTNVCAQPTIASGTVRSTAIRPFLGILGSTRGTQATGSSDTPSKAIEWSQLNDGRYAVVVVSSHGADGLLVDSIGLQASCSAC